MSTLQSAAPARPANGGARTFVRRLYFYGMTLISLIAALIAIDNLLYVIDQVWFDSSEWGTMYATGSYARDAIASSGGVLLVATPIFLLHWLAIQRRREPEELHSGMRKFFLYVAAAVTVGYAIYNVYNLLQGIAQLALGVPVAQSQIWPTGWFSHLGMAIIATALNIYFLNVAANDGDLGQEVGIAGTWRRLYMCAAGLFGLGMLILGSVGALNTLLLLAFSASGENVYISWWRSVLADNITQLLLGSVLLRLNWVRWQALSNANPQEATSALRRLYLYLAVVAGALTVLLPATELLRSVLVVLLSDRQLSDPMVTDALALALAAAPVGLFIWRWHWRYLQREADTYGESAQGATIRRLYYYAVALTGLVMVWFGATELVQAGIDWATGRAIGDYDVWITPLASGLSLLAVAAPIWAFHWQVAQRVARREDEIGRAERASAPRKVYLYGVALAGGLIILYYLAQVVYRLLLLLLGDPTASFVGAEPAGDLAYSIIAAIIWLVHVMAIRSDGQMGADPVETPVVVSPDERRALLEARINQLEMELNEARAELAALSVSN